MGGWEVGGNGGGRMLGGLYRNSGCFKVRLESAATKQLLNSHAWPQPNSAHGPLLSIIHPIAPHGPRRPRIVLAIADALAHNAPRYQPALAHGHSAQCLGLGLMALLASCHLSRHGYQLSPASCSNRTYLGHCPVRMRRDNEKICAVLPNRRGHAPNPRAGAPATICNSRAAALRLT